MRTILFLDGKQPTGAGDLPVVTNGMPALLCRIREGKIQLTLFGKTVPREYWELDNKTTIISCFFFPFTIAAVFNVDASKISKTPLDLRLWNAHKSNALITQLTHAKSNLARVQAIDYFLQLQVKESQRNCEIIGFATDHMMSNAGADVLPAILAELSLNERTFQRIFKRFVGITAVQYRRICQFQASFAQVKGQNFQTLSDIAYDNGFADQSHFNRSFREFTKTTPKKYLRHGLKANK